MVVTSLVSEELAATGAAVDIGAPQPELRLVPAVKRSEQVRAVAFFATLFLVQLGWIAVLVFVLDRALLG